MNINEFKDDYVHFTNDFMFCSVLENKALCKEFLQRILGIKIARIKCVCNQKAIKNSLNTKGIRLDIYVTDIYGNSYDIEMQTSTKSDLPLRIRYYHSEMDWHALNKGVEYSMLGKNIVIFVCTYDPYGYGDSLYTFKNTCQEHTELLLKDKIETIIVNTMGSHENLDEKLVNLLEYIKTGATNDSFTRKLESNVLALNSNTGWRDRYMTFEWELKERERMGREEGREEGRIEGREEGRTEGIEVGRIVLLIQLIKNSITNSIPLETIQPILGEDMVTIKTIYELIINYGIDYDDSKLAEIFMKRNEFVK